MYTYVHVHVDPVTEDVMEDVMDVHVSTKYAAGVVKLQKKKNLPNIEQETVQFCIPVMSQLHSSS